MSQKLLKSLATSVPDPQIRHRSANSTAPCDGCPDRPTATLISQLRFGCNCANWEAHLNSVGNHSHTGSFCRNTRNQQVRFVSSMRQIYVRRPARPVPAKTWTTTVTGALTSILVHGLLFAPLMWGGHHVRARAPDQPGAAASRQAEKTADSMLVVFQDDSLAIHDASSMERAELIFPQPFILPIARPQLPSPEASLFDEEVTLERCTEDPRWQMSLVKAIQGASPFPAPPDPAVFSNLITLEFDSDVYVAGPNSQGFETPAAGSSR